MVIVMSLAFLISSIVFIFICLIALFFIYFKQKTNLYLEKIDYTYNLLDTNLDKKLENLKKTYKEIKKNYLKKKNYFQDIPKDSLIDYDKELTNSTNILKDLINDNDKIKEDKVIKKLVKEIKNTDELIYSLKTYYNDNIFTIKKMNNNLFVKIILMIKKRKSFKTFEI